MATDFHVTLTADDILDLNTAVRINPVPLAERRQIAAALGKTERTVTRWFTQEATQTVNLIPSSVAGSTPQEICAKYDDETALRVMFAILYTGGANGDLFHKKDYERTGTYHTIVEIADRLRDIGLEKFHKWAIKSFSFVRFGDDFQWFHGYASPMEDESEILGDMGEFEDDFELPDEEIEEEEA